MPEYDPVKLLVTELTKAFAEQLWHLAVERAKEHGQSKVSDDDVVHAGQRIFFRRELSPELHDLLHD